MSLRIRVDQDGLCFATLCRKNSDGRWMEVVLHLFLPGFCGSASVSPKTTTTTSKKGSKQAQFPTDHGVTDPLSLSTISTSHEDKKLKSEIQKQTMKTCKCAFRS